VPGCPASELGIMIPSCARQLRRIGQKVQGVWKSTGNRIESTYV
jgi:hypothetical protein